MKTVKLLREAADMIQTHVQGHGSLPTELRSLALERENQLKKAPNAMKQPYLLIGGKVVDLINPEPEQIDLTAIERSLWTARRFSNNPMALLLRQHTFMVRCLAVILNANPPAIRWAEHHDDHEGIIGDVPGPLKTYIENSAAPGTISLSEIERRLDSAICGARGIDEPTDVTRKEVHFYDKLAETLEWLFVLKRAPEPWNQPWRDYLSQAEAELIVEKAVGLRAPPGLLPA